MKNKIVYDGRTFEATDIKSGQIHIAASLPSMKLEPNTFTAVVKSEDKSLTEFTRNTPLYYYYRERLVCISYVQTVDRIGPNKYKFYGTSAIGLLIEGLHYGGIYTGQTAQEVIADICGTVPFAVKSTLEGIKLYGWLPIASPRDNLAQVLFAIGVALKTDLDGVLRIEGLWDGISGTVTRNDMYTEAAVEYDGKVTQVIVSEHQYVPWTEEKQLFEGTAQAGDVITFDEPMHSLKAEGFSILDSGANWAKVSAGSGLLSGKAYLHNTRQVSKDVWPAKEPNVKTVKEATLVSLVNSQACAQRLADYYRCRERVDAPVVYRGELPGDRLATYHPFDKTGVAACLESADITLSNTLKAQEKSLVGFVPKQVEQVVTYDHHEILTGSGEWEIPEGVKEVLAVLIAGGQAGYDGRNGVSGSNSGTGNGKVTGSDSKSVPVGNNSSPTSFSASATSSSNGPISTGKGGPGGLAGTPGKVYQVTINVSGINSIRYSCGLGGDKNGAHGEETFFLNYTSGDGIVPLYGYTDAITGVTYAKKGTDGSSGGDGGSVGSDGESVDGVQGGKGFSSSSSTRTKSANGGYDGNGVWWINPSMPYTNGAIKTTVTYSYPGAGGGGSGGSSGANKGTEGSSPHGGSTSSINVSWSSSPSASATIPSFTSGSGGDGANGDKGATYGSSGDGGGGGGAPGAISKSSITGKIETRAYSSSSANTRSVSISVAASSVYPGSVGTGGKGGPGAPGCIILYYGIQKKIPTGQLVDKNHHMILDRLGRRIIM